MREDSKAPTVVSDDDEAEDQAPELQPGTEIAGYVIEAKIGQGGMGKVYGALHPRIGKRVAIKVLGQSLSGDKSPVARFEQEARLVNEIHHPNIVDVFQFGELPDKRAFFIMEWLIGESLGARIEKGPISAGETVEILDDVCDALEAAHEHGVIHRDLKADNVFLATMRGKRTVKLLDFGIAKLAGRNASSISKTATGIVVGTPAYMAPEQARGQTVDARTDVYQLGILAYRMLTGKLPFDAENPMDLILKQLKTPPPSPTKLAPETPDPLARLIVRMMAKAPDGRPSVAEVRKTFAELRAKTETSPRRRLPSVLLATLAFAGAISLGLFLLLDRDSKPAGTTPAPSASTPATEPAPGPTTGSAMEPSTVEPAPAAPAPTPAPTPVPAEIAIEPAAPPAPVAAPPSSTPPSASTSTPPPVKKRPRGSGTSRNNAADFAKALAADDGTPATKPGAVLLMLDRASTIVIDGKTIAQSSKGVRHEVRPGRHEVRVTAPGRQPVTRSVDVEAGGTAIIRITDDR